MASKSGQRVGNVRVSMASVPDHECMEIKRQEIAMKGYVYLFKSDGRFWKIGQSNSPKQRVLAFRSLPWNITIHHVIETDDMDWLEQKIHGIFHEKRRSGEWFELSIDDVEWLKNITVMNNEDGEIVPTRKKKHTTLLIRLTDDEKKLWHEYAKKHDIALSQVIRDQMNLLCMNGKRKTRLTMASELKGAN